MTRNPDTLAARLRLARRMRLLTQGELASAAGLEQPDISKLELGRMLSTTRMAQLAGALNVDALWLSEGVGPEPNWTSVQHASERPAAWGMAQEVIHPRPTINPIRLEWEKIMDPLPARFMLQVRDDSMSGGDSAALNVGDFAIFETGRPPRPGRNVLVRDSQGNIYIREYRVRTPTSWQAVARHPGFQALDSEEFGLTILAVQTGHLY